MENKKYSLRILPMFEDDLNAAVDYITDQLKNPMAADRLIDAVEAAIYRRLDNPEGFEEYHSAKERKYPYYRIYVNNYIIFYVIINDVMEVRRFVFNRRDMSKQV